MGVRSKHRRTLDVEGRQFLWSVHDNRDGAGLLLTVLSEDKRFIVCYQLAQPEGTRHLTMQGREFGRTSHAGGSWRRFRCPEWDPGRVVSPGSVRELIDWAMAPGEVIEVDYAGMVVPLGGTCTACGAGLTGVLRPDETACPSCGARIPGR